MAKTKDHEKQDKVPEFFCVYYMNEQKVYEMRMLLDNSMKTGSTSENGSSTGGSIDASAEAEGAMPFLTRLKGTISGEGHHEKQRKVVDTLEYVNTKSRMLADIMSRCSTKPLNTLEEGVLVYISDVSLKLLNENDVRALLAVMNGTFDGLTVPETGNLDFGHMMQSFVKNSAAFKLQGDKNGAKKHILLKIPIDSDDMFESKYAIDDLLIGKVGIVGVCKGTTKGDAIRTSLDFFQSESTECDEVIEGSSSSQKAIDEDEKGAHVYIDIIAIIQAVCLTDGKVE